jgi:hypothetical protein
VQQQQKHLAETANDQPQEPKLKGEGTMTTRDRATVESELAATTAAKEAAVTACDFERGAALRDDERRLQAELRALDPGVYRIRIDRPDGTYIAASSPSWAEALELAGFVDLTDELRLLLTAARVLDKAYSGGRVVR